MERKFSEQELVRRSKLAELQAMGLNPYEVQRVKRTYNLSEFNETFKDQDKEYLHNNEDKLEEIILAGRIMTIRQTFAVIQDFSGESQTYIDKKNVDPSIFSAFKRTDIGDIVEVHGKPMKTQTGTVTLKVSYWKIITKSLKVLPEKFHGLVDEELRARNRYVDLIVNDNSLKTFVLRSKIITAIRNYMDSLGYLEVETPVLNGILGGASARPFITHFNALDKNFYLRIATEISLKKCVVGGFEKVYEIGRIFRNEGMDSTHNPEFTSLEAYTAYIGMEETMELTEGIIKAAETMVHNYFLNEMPIIKDNQRYDNKHIYNYRGYEIDLSKPFKQIHMVDLIKEQTGINFFEIKSTEEAIILAKKHNIELARHELTFGHIVNAFFEKYGEEKCIQPTFVYGHPVEVSPLSKIDYEDTRFTKRFELFIGGKEFANAFSELNDPIDQFNRFEEQLKERELGNDEANEMDIDFVNALEYGLPPTGGLGIGIDRLVMLLSQKNSIRDVLLFPQMKDQNND